MLEAYKGTVNMWESNKRKQAVGEIEDFVISTLHPSPESELESITSEQVNFLLSSQHSWFSLV